MQQYVQFMRKSMGRIGRTWQILLSIMLVCVVALLVTMCAPAAQPTPMPPTEPAATATPEPTATPVPKPTAASTHTEAAAPVVQVRMSEFKFEPAAIRLKAGQPARIELINEGEIEHEVLIGRQLKLKDGVPHGYEKDFFDEGALAVETSGEEYHVGSPEEIAAEGWHVEIEPGGKALLTFTVPADRAGEWEIGCFIPGHYAAGMKGIVIVE